MLLKDVEIQVFELDNNSFRAIGGVNQFTSLIWPDKFNGYTTFELNAPVTPENRELLKKNNIIWCGGDNAAKIEIIQAETQENGDKTYKVKGRTLESLLMSRIIWGTYNSTNKYASTVMYEIVNSQCVNPSEIKRKIPFLECAIDEQLGKIISYQKTGGNVYDVVESIANDANLGFDIIFKPKEQKLVFKVTQSVDRTQTNDASKYVIFSTALDSILKSSYCTNNQDMKTLAYIMGEGEGVDRKRTVSGDDATSGFERKELYVDARDIQSEIQKEDGTTDTISDADYYNLLNNRGIEKLSECAETESFEAQMRTIGIVGYQYGVDYFKGDKVVIEDEELGVKVNAVITEVSENYDDNYELELTFGYEDLTLTQKIKRKLE